MHVENVRSVIEDLEREYTVLSDKLNEHEKQTDGKNSSLHPQILNFYSSY